MASLVDRRVEVGGRLRFRTTVGSTRTLNDWRASRQTWRGWSSHDYEKYSEDSRIEIMQSSLYMVLRRHATYGSDIVHAATRYSKRVTPVTARVYDK